jgi:phosphohistidine phosphatase
MHLYLVQHAQAMTEEEDPARPLTDNGREEAAKVARFAAERCGVRVSRILHSGKTRAAETAEILAEHIPALEGVQRLEGLAPMDDPMIVVRMLAESAEDLMLVGHLPHLGKLVGHLLCGDGDKRPVAFTMAGIVGLERQGDGGWSARWIVTPSIVP